MKVFTMTIQPGEFWIADIPFTNAAASKKRPVLVLWLDGTDLVAAAVTSASPRSPMDVALADWKAAGLRRASTDRLSRLDCLEQSLLIARVGAISTADGENVKQTWARHIRPQF
jgi:mRNA interferase MazF